MCHRWKIVEIMWHIKWSDCVFFLSKSPPTHLSIGRLKTGHIFGEGLFSKIKGGENKIKGGAHAKCTCMCWERFT